MPRIARPGLVLVTGLAIVVAAASLPAGIHGGEIPAASWISWIVVVMSGLSALYAVSRSVAKAMRNLLWLVPTVLLLSLPAALFAATGRGALVATALVLRALAAATAGMATIALLGPSGLIAALSALRVPRRLVAIAHAMLVSLGAIARQVSCMLRARAARRPSPAPWSALLATPVETLRGFGRLIGGLLLRSLERAESLDQARRARGGLDP